MLSTLKLSVVRRLGVGAVLASLCMLSAAKELPRQGTTSLEITFLDRVAIEVQTQAGERITDAEMDIYMNTPSVHFGLGDSSEPVIRRIKVTWGPLPPVYVTSSAFVDLHDPRRAELEVKGENLLLSIRGGDAASSYRAQIEIAPHGLVKRWVYNVKSGHEQITHYSYSLSHIESVRGELVRRRTKELEFLKRPSERRTP